MDKLDISNLSVLTTIGVYAWEQKIKQRLFIDISIPQDVSQCQDKLNETLDYEALCQQVTFFVEQNSFALIETVANEVAQLIKTQFNVEQLTVRVSKPHAIQNAGNISITVAR